ncbi:MAG: hypothetical protein LBE91_14605 [Tannerella sp.]|nr:hypothetical protein [Tannerella sp.]
METKANESGNIAVNPGDVVTGFSLTVAESKRLIAKGIKQHPMVQEKLKSGMIVIARGSTNTYVAEELIDLQAPHGKFVTGNISNDTVSMSGEKISEIVIIDGKQVEMPFKDALAALKEGDLIFKGGNLLNYERKQAAVTIGSEDGGTVRRLQPYSAGGPAHLIVPIGLEKEIGGDLSDYAKILTSNIQRDGVVPRLIIHQNGEIFTEIEAIKLFGNVNVIPFAAGGIAGNEGGISFAVYGAPQEVEKIKTLIASIKGEPAFL